METSINFPVVIGFCVGLKRNFSFSISNYIYMFLFLLFLFISYVFTARNYIEAYPIHHHTCNYPPFKLDIYRFSLIFHSQKIGGNSKHRLSGFTCDTFVASSSN